MRFLNRCAAAALISALVLVGAGCSTPPGSTGILAVVELESGATARCVKVSATDGTLSMETEKMVVGGKTSLRVGIVNAGFVGMLRLKAHGFSDIECVTANGEESAEVPGTFAAPPSMVTLRLGPVSSGDGGMNGDGGADAGADAGSDAGFDAGTDAGFDAGVDNDMDTVPLPADCNDNDNTVFPGMTELCGDGKDNNCANGADCADTSGVCNGMNCGGMNTCVSGVCMGLSENCVDGIDNNGNMLVDCLDPGCQLANTACNDSSMCTTGETCLTDGGCGNAPSVVMCTPTEAQCQMNGACQPDSGVCTFTNTTNACNDMLACTAMSTCMNGACVSGPTTPCTSPPVCRRSTTCAEPSGMCVYPPVALGVGTCSDTDNCTINDACDGDGGCAGTMVSCTSLSQCHTVVPGMCTLDGGCTFTPTAGPCDAGTSTPGTCDSSFACVPPAVLFGFAQSNFTDQQMPDAGANLDLNGCTVTINTNGATPTIMNTGGGCFTNQPFRVFTPAASGSQPSVIVGLSGLRLRGNSTITVSGDKPLILAVLGNVNIEGTITLNNAGGTSSQCGNGGKSGVRGGGGGGGFGSPGGVGGSNFFAAGAGDAGVVNGADTLVPIRAGCDGSAGSDATGADTTNGGRGGGALQITTSGTLRIDGTITAPGRGGAGALPAGRGGGAGGSGGAILLEGGDINLTGNAELTANGGGGGEGSRGVGGNPGGDAPTNTTLGGTAGGGASNDGGNGGRGAGQTQTVEPGFPGTMSDAAGGGGGGGMGRIRVNTNSTCTLNGGRLVSPTASTNCP